MKTYYLLLLSLFVACQQQMQQREFRFALITDTHLRADDTTAYNDLQRTIEHINQSEGLAFVLVTGDLTEAGDRASLRQAKHLLDGLNIPYYPLSGNHETKWSDSGATDFAHIFGSERFDFTYGNYRFMGFGTGPIIRMMEGHVAPQDISWLKEELAATPKQPTILVTHYPLQPGDVDNWYLVTDAVRSYPVKAFLGGHYHTNRLLHYDGIPAFLCRSNLRDKEDGIGGYSVFEITADSIKVYEQKSGRNLQPWGGYSLQETYYTADNSSYPRPDYSVNDPYPNAKEDWLVTIPNAVYASPWVHNGNVYIGDDTGIFYCLSTEDGKEKWRFASDNRIVGTADAEDGIVVFGSADRKIYALDERDGKLLWSYHAKEPILGSARIYEGIAYIGASDSCFRAFEAQTGRLLWEYCHVEGYIETRPFIYEDKVIFGAWDNNMYAFERTTGELQWCWDGGYKGFYSPAAVWPVAAEGKVFFTAPDRVMTAIDASKGTTVWRTNESVVRETIGLSEDKKRIYSKTMQDTVVCYSTTGNKPVRIWATDVGYGYDHAASMPVEKEGVVFGSTKNGIMFGLEGKTGELLWKHKTGNSLIGTVFPLSKEECIFTSSEGLVGKLKIYDK